MALYKDRSEAGRLLAAELVEYSDKGNGVILAIPRGGVPVAYEVAKRIHNPLDVMIVRKLGVPGNQELAMGAIVSGGIRILNHDVVRMFNISQFGIDAVAAEQQAEIERCEQLYRAGWPALELYDRTVIVVDDGIATGATMRAAVAALKQRDVKRIVVAVPTATKDACNTLINEADELVCLGVPEPYIAVGRWYKDFSQTSDEEVSALLAKSAKDYCVLAATSNLH